MWLPVIQFHIPGCGLTPFNVMALTLNWWRVYRDHAVAAVEDQNKQAQANRGRRG